MTLNEAFALAFSHYRAGRTGDAVAVCRAILAAIPEQPDTLHLLGLALLAAGDVHAAADRLERTLAVRPDFAEALGNLGILRQDHGRPAVALVLHGRALALRDWSGGRINRGNARRALGDHDGAEADYTRAMALGPDEPMPANSLGTLLREKGRIGRAIALHRRAAVLAPGMPDAWRDLGHALREGGLLTAAAAAYGRSYRLEPARTEMMSYRLFSLQAVCDWTGYDALCRETAAIIDADRGVALPLGTLSIELTAEQQLRSARLFSERLVRAAHAPPYRPPPAGPRERLRIGYFSADFHEHATAYLAAELFELHDRGGFEILAFSFGPDDGSPMRRRLVQAFDRFHDIRNAGVDRVAALVAEEGVDILVDLKGYTKQSRLDLLSRRLAPVQATYLGYPGTTGCDVLDYVIGDRFVTPPEHQAHFTERLVVMPDSYQINDRRRPLDGRVPTRAECGLPEDAVVFCAFNTTYKITPAMFGIWMRLLARLPGSVLWLFEANPEAAGNLRRAAAARGIDPARLVFAPKRPLPDHLARYRIADLGLDSFPYTGHTTTSDALWVGMPVVTLMGGTFASRVAAGLLSAAGVPELITTSPAAYEELARHLALDPAARGTLRRRLEETRLTVPLFDSRRFTRHLERAYRTMWEIHASGAPPRGFLVPPLPPGAVA
jgi:protein O-GlcNAc transferase